METDIYVTYNIGALAAARMIAAGADAARQRGLSLSLVVVDAAGQLVQASRMDGATLLSLEIARRKAFTAAMARADTDSVRAFVNSDEGSRITMPSLPDFSMISGGLPIVVDGHYAGALGASGATAELDLEIAHAALAGI